MVKSKEGHRSFVKLRLNLKGLLTLDRGLVPDLQHDGALKKSWALSPRGLCPDRSNNEQRLRTQRVKPSQTLPFSGKDLREWRRTDEEPPRETVSSWSILENAEKRPRNARSLTAIFRHQCMGAKNSSWGDEARRSNCALWGDAPLRLCQEFRRRISRRVTRFPMMIERDLIFESPAKKRQQ